MEFHVFRPQGDHKYGQSDAAQRSPESTDFKAADEGNGPEYGSDIEHASADPTPMGDPISDPHHRNDDQTQPEFRAVGDPGKNTDPDSGNNGADARHHRRESEHRAEDGGPGNGENPQRAAHEHANDHRLDHREEKHVAGAPVGSFD